MKMALAIVQLDQLLIRPVVTNDDVEIAVSIDVGKRCGVGPVGRFAQGLLGEMTLAVVAQDEIVQRPMPAFCQNDVQIAISIDVPEAYAGGSFTHFLKQQHAIKRSQFAGFLRNQNLGEEEGKL